MERFEKLIEAKTLARGMTRMLAIMLLMLAAVLSILLIQETWELISILLRNQPTHDSYKMVEGIVVWFLYFEFIALIAKYFESKYHFPLRYFIYIGITAIVRLVIVDHEKPMATLIYSAAILVLLGALYIANSKLLKRT